MTKAKTNANLKAFAEKSKIDRMDTADKETGFNLELRQLLPDIELKLQQLAIDEGWSIDGSAKHLLDDIYAAKEKWSVE